MTPVLYILMRTDLPSMNAGKAMAQASHASNAFVKMSEGDLVEPRATLAKTWQQETSQGFGTVLVLAATGEQIEKAVSEARARLFSAARITDPTYPYRVTGEIAKLLHPTEAASFEGGKEYTLVRSEMTCAFIFGEKADPVLQEIVGHLKLHP